MAANDIERFARADLNNEIEFLLARARAVGIGHANKRFVEVGLKARSYAVLSLAASDLEPTQRELADFLSLDASQIVALVDNLEASDLVERRPSPSDRRTNVIVATARGRELYVRAREASRMSEAESLAALSPGERDTLRELLAKVAF